MQDYVPEELKYAYESYSRHPYYGFRLSARDAARFGLLFLRDGRSSEQQVVAADWMRESTISHSVIGPHGGYGYMWWTGEGEGVFPTVDEGPGSYYASGANGQEIIVMPSRNLVVVHLVDSDADHSVDETSIGTLLWKAKIHPLRPIPTLTDAEVAALWEALRDILQGSIDADGAPFELNLYGQKGSWDDPYLFHWEEGAPCPVCGTPLAKIRTGSTGSYVCPGCQALQPK